MFYFFSGSYLSYILSCCNAFTCFHAVSDSLLFTHTCPVTEFAVASHLNTANSCCHHVFLRHFRFQKCLPVNSNTLSAHLPLRHLISWHFRFQKCLHVNSHGTSRTLVASIYIHFVKSRHFKRFTRIPPRSPISAPATVPAARSTGR